MKVVKQSCNLINGLAPYEHLERVGRTCYKSEDLITEGSAEKFVASLVKRKHWAILEHYTIYLTMEDSTFFDLFMKECEVLSIGARIDKADDQEQFKYFNWSNLPDKPIISGSFRAFHDLFLRTECGRIIGSSMINYVANILKEMFPIVFNDITTVTPTLDFSYSRVKVITGEELVERYKDRPDIIRKHLTHTMHFVTDRGVSHEFVRHRNCAFAQESTRYCNYAKDKFGNEITVIEPCFWEGENSAYLYEEWEESCVVSEKKYFRLLDMGATPQEARGVLPNSLKTELIITCTEKEWQHIANLRYYGTTGAPHPQIKEAMTNAMPLLSAVSKGRIE